MRVAIVRIIPVALLLAAMPLIGTAGFMLIERWSFFDSLYMAVITITTVGFSEIHPLHTGGRIFIICYLTVGLGVFTYSLIQIGELVYRAKLRDWLARRRMDSAIKTMKDHFIICGMGRMGRTVCRYLGERNIPFVAIDREEESLEECREHGWPWLAGDATDDDTLKTAGIERARGLAAVLASDADNVFIVLSARLLTKDLQIIARASDEDIVPKLMKAGANRVVGLYDTGAAKMAQLLINPQIHDFIESFGSRGTGLDLAEIRVTASAPYAGLTLEQTDFRKRGVIIVAIRRGEELLLPPPTSEPIRPEDRLIAVGRIEAISGILDKCAEPAGAK